MTGQMGIQDLLRASDTKRWIIVRTAVTQSVAEHTFNVVMIARAIAKECGVDDKYVMKYALDHDLDEIRTGDIPAPTKKTMAKEGTHVEYRGNNKPKHVLLRHIVKGADLIEACWFISENAVGRHAKEVECYMWQKLDEFTGSTSLEIRDAVLKISNQIFEQKFMII